MDEDFRSTVRAFANAEVRPGAAERDATGQFPADLLARLGELDLMGITAPERHGGLDLPTAVQLAAIEEIARADAALASIHTAHYLAMEPLLLAADDDQLARWLPQLTSGQSLAAFALTEPDAGSDIAGMRTTAHRDDHGWRLSGTKTFISNARQAGLIVVFARTGTGFGGISAFLLPAGTPGVSFSEPQEKLGIRSAPTYTVHLDDVVLDEQALLGELGRGGKLALEALNRARIDVAAMANGISLRARDLAGDYAARREQFGRPIADFQAVQLLLGTCEAQLVPARLTADWAAGIKDTGADLRRASSLAKYVASEACSDIVDHAVQIHGGAGFMRESEVERLYRDSRILRIFEGTSQIQLLTVAAHLPAAA